MSDNAEERIAEITKGLTEEQAAEVKHTGHESGEMDAENQANKDRERGGSGAI